MESLRERLVGKRKYTRPVDPEGREKRLQEKIALLKRLRESAEQLENDLLKETEEYSLPEYQALQDLETWKNLHCGVVEFSLGDSAAKELGTERVVQDNVDLLEANAIGSYVLGSAEPTEVVVDPWDDRKTEVKLDKRQGKHRVLLDLDVQHVYVPSSTPGHGHLIIDVHQDFNTVLALLNMMFDMGILQSGFASATKTRGETWLRAPGVKKDHETDGI